MSPLHPGAVPVLAPPTRADAFGIAGVQMNVVAFADNVDRIAGYMRHIRSRFPWVRMVLFSELSALGPRHEAEPLPGPTEARLCELARETGLWLIPGSLFEKVESRDGSRTVELLWPGQQWQQALTSFQAGERSIRYPAG